MKHVLFALLVFTFIINLGWAGEPLKQAETKQQLSQDQITTCDKLKADGASSEVLAKRGCCSHHSGVCSCSGGRVVCCDGSYSPSCGCHKEDQVVLQD
jgi:hypothetical protein